MDYVVTIELDKLNKAMEVLSDARENGEQLLKEHDEKFGRTTRGNKYEAEWLESHIGKCISTSAAILEAIEAFSP